MLYMQFGELVLVIFNESVSQFTELNVVIFNNLTSVRRRRTDPRINVLINTGRPYADCREEKAVVDTR